MELFIPIFLQSSPKFSVVVPTLKTTGLMLTFESQSANQILFGSETRFPSKSSYILHAAPCVWTGWVPELFWLGYKIKTWLFKIYLSCWAMSLPNTQLSNFNDCFTRPDRLWASIFMTLTLFPRRVKPGSVTSRSQKQNSRHWTTSIKQSWHNSTKQPVSPNRRECRSPEMCWSSPEAAGS